MSANLHSVLASIALMLREHPELQDDETLRADMIEGCTDLPEAIDAILESAEGDKALADAITARAAKLEARSAMLMARHKAKRKAIASALGEAGVKSLPLVAGTVSLIRGRISPKVDDVAELPQGYFSEATTRKANMEAIKAAIASGEQIPGVLMVTGEDYIQVR